MPPELMNRLRSGDALSRTVAAAIRGAQEGWGPSGPPPSAQMPSPHNLRFFNDSVANPLNAAWDFFTRTTSAAVSGAGAAGGQLLREAGPAEFKFFGKTVATGEDVLGTPEQMEEGTKHFLSWLGMRGDIGAELVRPMPMPDGTYADVIVGHPPDDGGSSGGMTIAQHYGLPGHSVQAIERAYIHRGVLPAEMFHDIANDPSITEDLAAGHIPRVYGGEPQAVTSLPNVAPEDFARLSQEAALKEKQTAVAEQLKNLPEGDASAADRLNRLRAVEQQLAGGDLTPEATKKLAERRDQILVDTTPEALKAAAAPLEQRRALEAQQASIQAQLDEIAKATRPTTEGPASAVTARPAEPTPAAPTPSEPAAAPAAKEPVTQAALVRPEGTPRPGGAVTIVKGTGEEHTPVLAARLVASDIERGLYDEADVPTRNRTNDADQRQKVADLFNENPQKMIDALMGRGRMPAGVLPEFLLAGGRAWAEKVGDYGLLRDLATKSRVVRESSTIAARLRAHQEMGGDTDPLTAIKAIEDAREAAAKSKGQDVAAETEKAVQQVRATKAEAAPKPDAWQKFLDEIVCK